MERQIDRGGRGECARAVLFVKSALWVWGAGWVVVVFLFFFCLNLTLEATLKPPCCCVTGMDSLRAANAWELKSGSISRTGQK